MLWLRSLLFTIVMYAAALAHEAGCPTWNEGDLFGEKFAR
jgi:hypothetical protein